MDLIKMELTSTMCVFVCVCGHEVIKCFKARLAMHGVCLHCTGVILSETTTNIVSVRYILYYYITRCWINRIFNWNKAVLQQQSEIIKTKVWSIWNLTTVETSSVCVLAWSCVCVCVCVCALLRVHTSCMCPVCQYTVHFCAKLKWQWG